MPGSTKLLSPIISTARRADDRQPTLKSSPFGRPGTNCRLCPRRVRPPREAGAPVEMAGEGRFCTPVGMEGRLENIGSGLIPFSVVPAQALRMHTFRFSDLDRRSGETACTHLGSSILVVVPVKAGTQEFRQDSGFRLFAAWSLSSGRPKAGPGGPERREQLCNQRPFILVCMPRGRATCV